MITRGIILANGDPPELVDLHYLKSVGFSTIICADGGANSAFALKIRPNIIIGDLDSADERILEYYKDKSDIIHFSRQDDTDVEKALKFSIEKGIQEVVLTGATGDRLDHTFCNMGITLKFFDQIKIFILHKKSILEVREGEFEFPTTPGETISLYGFDKTTLVTTRGLKYPLHNESLQFGERESTSNEAIGDIVKIAVNGGRIFMIRYFEEAKKNGYFS